MKIDISGAENVLVPKGTDNAPIRQAFELATGLEIPSFTDGKDSANSQGVMYWNIKAKDIPALVGAGFAEVGVTGTDNCVEYEPVGSSEYRIEVVGKKIGIFSLLGASESIPLINQYIQRSARNYKVATSFPRLLRSCAAERQLSIEPASVQVSGSVEAMKTLLKVPLAADLVVTGGTARANGLEVVCGLREIKPAILVRS